MREILACKSEKYIYVYVYNNLLSGGINARAILYRDLLFPTTNRSNLIFIKILRDEKLRRAKGYYASCGPWRNRVAFDESVQSSIRINFKTSWISI